MYIERARILVETVSTHIHTSTLHRPDTFCFIDFHTRRKGLAIDTFNHLKHTLESKKVLTKTKRRILQAFVNSIFLYYSELWTLTKALAHNVDVFQRSLLRRVVGTRRIENISNIDLYNKTETIPWSVIIQWRRLN